MNRLSHQPKALVLAVALALGFATIGAGCTPGNQDNDATTPATPATVTNRDMTPNNGTTGTQANNGAYGTPTNNGAYGSPANNGTSMSSGVGDSTQPVSDTWISAKVHAKLNTIGGLDNTDVEVETNNGVVVLTGRMKSQAQVDKAVAAIKTLKGVKKVDTSRLKIGPDTNQ